MYKNTLLKTPFLILLCALCSGAVLASTEEYPSEKPVLYLTFDDGPSSDEVTERILDVLAEHDAKATFFVTGVRARSAPDKIARIVNDGHALGNHALSHRDLTTLPDHIVAEEFSVTNQFIYAAGGPTINCFRAPFGETNRRVNGIAGGMGMRSVGWSIDTRDWDSGSEPDHLVLQLENSYHESIVLMHDGPVYRWRTFAVFSSWMQDAADLYDFQALPECIHPHTYTETYAESDVEPFVSGDTQVLNTQVLNTQSAAIDETAPESVLESEPEYVPEKMVYTIAQIIEKLGTYEFFLDPEVVAQTGIQHTSY